MDNIIGYKLNKHNSPESKLAELVKLWNDLEFESDTLELRLYAKNIKDEIGNLQRDYNLPPVTLKNYGF